VGLGPDEYDLTGVTAGTEASDELASRLTTPDHDHSFVVSAC
jgi:hypothetical protein